jgi:hypothetical protein
LFSSSTMSPFTFQGLEPQTLAAGASSQSRKMPAAVRRCLLTSPHGSLPVPPGLVCASAASVLVLMLTWISLTGLVEELNCVCPVPCKWGQNCLQCPGHGN